MNRHVSVQIHKRKDRVHPLSSGKSLAVLTGSSYGHLENQNEWLNSCGFWFMFLGVLEAENDDKQVGGVDGTCWRWWCTGSFGGRFEILPHFWITYQHHLPVSFPGKWQLVTFNSSRFTKTKKHPENEGTDTYVVLFKDIFHPYRDPNMSAVTKTPFTSVMAPPSTRFLLCAIFMNSTKRAWYLVPCLENNTPKPTTKFGLQPNGLVGEEQQHGFHNMAGEYPENMCGLDLDGESRL